MVGQKTSKSANFLTLENFRLYGMWLAIIFYTGNNYNVLNSFKEFILRVFIHVATGIYTYVILRHSFVGPYFYSLYTYVL